MMTFEQTPVVSPLPAVSHSLHITSQIGPAWSLLPGELVSPDYRGGPGINFSEEGWLILENATARGSELFISQLVPLDPRMDHVLAMPVEITGGRFVVRFTDPDTRTLLASAAVPDVFQGLPADRPPSNVLQVPFVSLGKDRMMISIVGADNESVSGRVGPITLSQLGESSYTWTRAPRFVLRTFQKLFTTRKMWPGIFCGLTVLLIAGRWRQALTILIVPAYYYVVHSPIHTEYRYVVGNHYFLLIFAAVVVYWVGTILVRIVWLVRRDRRLKLSVR